MKSRIGLTLGVLLLVSAGRAGATPVELNIYGSSSQASYWAAQAVDFARYQFGCWVYEVLEHHSAKHYLISAHDCASTLVPDCTWVPYLGWDCDGSRDLDIRVSGIASAEGPLSVDKEVPLDEALSAGCNIANGERLMYASGTTTVCKQVHIGTSDVAGESFTQLSTGERFGPMGGGSFSATLTGVDTSNLIPFNTMVVPFGFFVNQAVTAKSCTAGLTGNYCTDNAQCETAPGAANGVCGGAAPITNITREEVSLIFSGNVADWSDLGAYYTAQPAIACLRHAGSGTHSAFDLTVMNSAWGANTITEEIPGQIYFNQGSSDEIRCVNGNSTATPKGSLIGAIGYANADQAIGVSGKSQNVRQLKYNGVYPTRAAIRNGQYDFYTNAWFYTNPENDPSVNAIAEALHTFAEQPENVPASKANYWATISEMKYNRGADYIYPAFTGARIPLLP